MATNALQPGHRGHHFCGVMVSDPIFWLARMYALATDVPDRARTFVGLLSWSVATSEASLAFASWRVERRLSTACDP
eukprot:4555682-Prymnesium_polylepis.1